MQCRYAVRHALRPLAAVAFILACHTPFAEAGTILWGDLLNAGGWAEAGVYGDDGRDEDHYQEQNPLLWTGSQQARAEDRFGDLGSSMLRLDARGFHGETFASLSEIPPHQGAAWGRTNGGTYGSFTIAGGNGPVDLPLLVDGYIEAAGPAAGLGLVTLNIMDEQNRSLFMDAWRFTSPGAFRLDLPIRLDLAEGQTYYYSLSSSIDASVTTVEGRPLGGSDHSGRASMSVLFGEETTQPVPEPASALLLGPALGMIWFAARRRTARSKAAADTQPGPAV